MRRLHQTAMLFKTVLIVLTLRGASYVVLPVVQAMLR
jgi:hypothetical protein